MDTTRLPLLCCLDVLFLVPVNFLGGVHGNGQDDEDAETAYQEGVALQLHDDIDEEVEHGEETPNAKGSTPMFEQGPHEESDEGNGHAGSYEVGEEEGEVLGEGEQQGVEKYQGEAHQCILDGVDGGLATDFDKEHHRKGEQDDEVGILDAARGLLVLFDRNAEADIDGAGILQGIAAGEHLREVAVES